MTIYHVSTIRLENLEVKNVSVRFLWSMDEIPHLLSESFPTNRNLSSFAKNAEGINDL